MMLTMGLVGLLLFALVGSWIFFILRKNKEDLSSKATQDQLLRLHERIHALSSEISDRTTRDLEGFRNMLENRLQATNELMQKTHETVGSRLDRNTEVFGRVQEKLGKIEETSRQVQSVGLEIAKLQNVLQAPKLRGNLGELFLEELLSQILPQPYYEIQHRFRTGSIADAAILLPQNQKIAVDAKFPLENFQRLFDETLDETKKRQIRRMFEADIKKHIDTIASRYILPSEGTLDFALMYIPAENVYYEAFLRDDRFGEEGSLNQIALNKRVIPVSPNCFYAYLQAIVLGLKGLKIEKRAQEIFGHLTYLKNEMTYLREDMDLVGKHLSNAKNAHDKMDRRMDRFQNKLSDFDEPKQISPIQSLPE